MPKKPVPKQDLRLKTFIKAGGRKDAETDFNQLLKRAVKPKEASKSADKTK